MKGFNKSFTQFVTKRSSLLKITGVLLVLFSLNACSPKEEENAQIMSITPQDAAKMLDEKQAVIVDVREIQEWNEGHILGAKHIPVAQITTRLAELEEFRDSPVIMQCRSGVRSAQAAVKLKAAGFKEIYNMEGGILAWDEATLPTEK